VSLHPGAMGGAISCLTLPIFSINSHRSRGGKTVGSLPACGEATMDRRERVMDKMPITKAGFERMKRELEVLKTVSIPANIKEIEVARAQGDLSENAEYTAAKERQSFLHGRMQEIENNLAMSNVIDLKNLCCDKAVFGATVTIADSNTGKQISYQLVGPCESDLEKNRISVTSPIGKALIGRSVGDEVSVNTPGGIREFEVVDISIREETD
jgi:transcription elongation factor GreA